jgi:hypothetical protein
MMGKPINKKIVPRYVMFHIPNLPVLSDSCSTCKGKWTSSIDLILPAAL